ncbi:hypothetical protein [Nocardia vulneris]|uniref:Uncharacterized protein n=1 Tax=Nocardia vulneris TaxID=1141657 RepID=A0ABR4ZJW7_9NOCA|nr:hypothetical protein [Nocardia vulneris]KIA65706.1 hypothetical protein FG87_06645 [Nocardia vulneris]
MLAAGFAFAAIAAAAGGTYPLAIALAVLAVPFAIPTVLQVLGELLIYLMIPAAVVAFVLLLPVLVLSPAARSRARRQWHRYRAQQL